MKIPDNICLWHIRPYCPELKPMERFWQDIKAAFTWKNFQDREQLDQWLEENLTGYSKHTLASLTAYPHIIDAKHKAIKYVL